MKNQRFSRRKFIYYSSATFLGIFFYQNFIQSELKKINQNKSKNTKNIGNRNELIKSDLLNNRTIWREKKLYTFTELENLNGKNVFN